MSVYIPGMEMPTSGRILIVFPSGRVLEVSADETQDVFGEAKAVPVPEHGKLLKVLKTERDCVSRDCDRNCGKCELALEQSEILAVYDVLIAMFSPADKEGEG